MLRIKRGGSGITIKLKSEYCIGPRANCVHKIFSFSVLNNSFFAIARNGLVQLYERQKAPQTTLAYKLVREWKNSTVSPRDRVICIGSFRNQYMFTCSNEGKFVIRDLINDDADESVKVYLLEGPISCIDVAVTNDSMRVIIGAGGKDNDVKLYDLDFGPNQLYSAEGPSPNLSSVVRFANDTIPPLRRSQFLYFTAFSDWKRLTPVVVMSSAKLSCLNSAFHWILSVCFVEHKGKRVICAGTQYGMMLVYEAERPYSQVEKTSFRLSQFPINVLRVFSNGRYLLYSDTMSKVGVIDVELMKVVNFYDYLKFGPNMTCRIFTSSTAVGRVSCNTGVSRFMPIYVVATTIDGNILVYKLHDTNEKELKLFINQAGVVPDLEILEADSYTALEAVFVASDTACGQKKRRKNDKLSDGQTSWA